MKTVTPLLRGWPTQCRKYLDAMKYFSLCLCLVFALVQGLGAELVDRVVAIVNNDVILLSDLRPMLAAIDASLDKQGYDQKQKDMILKQQRSHILEQLIYDKLTDQQVKQHNIKIDDSEVDATIQRIQQINRLSEDTLRRNLEAEGLTFNEYREQIKEKLLRSRLVNREVKSKIVITDQDIKSYYDAHLEEYGGHTKCELWHILIKVPAFAGSAEKERARQKIDQIYRQLQSGESFAELAAKYSEAPSATHDGYLGVFDLKMLSDQIKKALKGLNAKQFTEVVDTDQGFQIFYIANVNQSGGKGVDEVRAEIQDKLFADVVDQKFEEWIRDLRKRSHIQIME